ncbi:MAG: dTDP-4-dehydrorhamnose reductase [Enterobacterales bacterium]|jgi:dTDP-4-dehydrorhamnose reductase
MKILILGGSGMLGFQLFKEWRESHTVRLTLRGSKEDYPTNTLLNADTNYFNVDVSLIDCLKSVLNDFRPDVVVNAIGITKQLTETLPVEVTNYVNARFPHFLSDICGQHQCRLIHMSSDCVFSGKKGDYTEDDKPDAEDLYGQSKYLGEVSASHVLTLRKSTIGLELSSSHGLIEWFLQQQGNVRGYTKAIYSGLIASELASVIEKVLLGYPGLNGVFHVASQAISKYDLLLKLSQHLNRKDINIIPFDDFICDRSLNGSRFSEITGYKAPSWDDMIVKLASEISKREST